MKKKTLFLGILWCTLTAFMLAGCEREEPAGSVPKIELHSLYQEETEAVKLVQRMGREVKETAGEVSEAAKKKGYLIAIDAGHQMHGNSETEPVGPGAAEYKAKVAGGTSGTVTGMPEYELTLQVSLKLRDELAARGYDVLMIRETNEVNISNSERAMMANDASADAFIRIHANGAASGSASGMMTICQTPSNPYNGALYGESRRFAELILSHAAALTGARTERVWETDTMSGINWAMVPTTILEMGYMTNPAEDQLMATEEYQMQIVNGIADGIDEYFQK